MSDLAAHLRAGYADWPPSSARPFGKPSECNKRVFIEAESHVKRCIPARHAEIKNERTIVAMYLDTNSSDFFVS